MVYLAINGWIFHGQLLVITEGTIYRDYTHKIPIFLMIPLKTCIVARSSAVEKAPADASVVTAKSQSRMGMQWLGWKCDWTNTYIHIMFLQFYPHSGLIWHIWELTVIEQVIHFGRWCHGDLPNSECKTNIWRAKSRSTSQPSFKEMPTP